MSNKRVLVGTRKRKLPRESKPIIPDKDDMSLDDALELFVQAKRVERVRDSTIRDYYSHIEYLSDYMTEVECLKKPFIGDLTAVLIRRYINYMLTEKTRYSGIKGRRDKFVGLSPTTVNIRLRTLRTMCRFWYKEGISDINAMENIKPLRLDEEDEVVGLTDEELRSVIANLDELQFAEWRDKILIIVMLDTGLRPGEACGMTIDRVDFRTLTLSVPSKVAKNRRNRDVPLSRDVAKMIRELYEESIEYFGETEYVFNNAYGEPFTSDAFRKRLNRLKRRIGMSKLAPNMFRHTFCRKYIINGGDIFTLQKIVDHADIKTTRKYVQMDMTDIRGQHNKYSPVHRILRRQ